jgi:acyl dehydratase
VSLATDLAARLAGLPGPAAPLTRVAEVPVSEHAIRTWCAAVGEEDPVHLDREAARRAGYPDVVAPPALLQTWTMPIGARARAVAPTLHSRVRAAAREAGLGAVVATDYEQDYLAVIHPGQVLAERSWIDAVSPLKTTALGPGQFVTIAFEIADEQDRTVGRMRARTLYFDPAPTARGGAGLEARDPVDPGELEPLEIPLSRTLIIAASLASNDHEPVHHDHEVARAQSLDDIIAGIVTTAGLVLRFAGLRGVRARSLRLRLARPAFPGDRLVLRGRRLADRPSLAVWGDHARGRHVTAEVGVVHPS